MTERDALFVLIGVNLAVLALLLFLVVRSFLARSVDANPRRSFAGPIIFAVLASGISVGIYSYFSPSDESAKARIASMERQLKEARQWAAADIEAARKNEEIAKAATEKARQAEEAARRSGDLKAQQAAA